LLFLLVRQRDAGRLFLQALHRQFVSRFHYRVCYLACSTEQPGHGLSAVALEKVELRLPDQTLS
jgi:hypothetical protein